MAKFINVVTGNELETDNSIAIKLMEKSPRYQKVEEGKKNKAAASAKTAAAPAEDS